jgi:general secretion pathway protein K
MRGHRHPPPSRQQGAALLLAMIIVTLVSTVAAGMVWQQARAVNVEAAERTRAQMSAFSGSGMDFVRGLIRQSLARGVTPERIKELVERRIEPASLSSLVAADRNNTLDVEVDVTIAMSGSDAGARYNLRNLVDRDGKPVEAEAKTLQRLCEALGLSSDVALTLAAGLQQAWAPPGEGADPSAPLAPNRPVDLVWLGLDAATVATLAAHVEILPTATPVNINTASAEVIYAVLDGLKSLAEAKTIERPKGPVAAGSNKMVFRQLTDLQALLPEGTQIAANRVALVSSHFHTTVTLRYEDRVLEESYLVRYVGPGNANAVTVLRRERTFSKAPSP